MDKISILIPDGESPFALHVLACFAPTKNVEVHILSKKNDAVSKYSRGISSFHLLKDGQSLLDGVADCCSQIHVDLCMPVDMDGIYYFAEHCEQTTQLTRLMLMESSDNLRTVWDKGLLADYLQANQLSHPESITSRAQFDKSIAGLPFPVLIKPRLAGNGDGIVKYTDRKKLMEYVDSRANFFKEFIIQEFIDGEDIDCSVYCKDGRILAYTIQKAIYLNSDLFQPAEGVEFVHHAGVIKLVEELVSALKWSGVAHIDMRICDSDGSVKVIEINPRFWGSIEGSLHVGVNFPYLACLASLGESFPMPEFRESKYMSFFAAFKRLLKKKPIMNIFSETNLLLQIKDPLPIIMRLRK
jgi:predicted ATP-grasp superfamily ATP-dependent carboligase